MQISENSSRQPSALRLSSNTNYKWHCVLARIKSRIKLQKKLSSCVFSKETLDLKRYEIESVGDLHLDYRVRQQHSATMLHNCVETCFQGAAEFPRQGSLVRVT